MKKHDENPENRENPKLLNHSARLPDWSGSIGTPQGKQENGALNVCDFKAKVGLPQPLPEQTPRPALIV